MVKKNNYFTCFIFFCRFTLLVCGEKNILSNLTNSQEPEPGVFSSFEPEPLEKKTRSRSQSRSRLGKNQEPEPLEKKVRSRSLKKFAGSPALFIASIDCEIVGDIVKE